MRTYYCPSVMTSFDDLLDRVDHLVSTQPIKSDVPIFSREHTPNCLGSALFAHGISNFEIPDFVPMTFGKYLFDPAFFDRVLKPGSIGYFTYRTETGEKEFHSFVVLDVLDSGGLSVYQQSGFGKRHVTGIVAVDSRVKYFFPKVNMAKETKRAIRESFLKHTGMTVDLFNEVNSMDVSTLRTRLDPMHKLNYEMYCVSASNRKQTPLDLEDFLAAFSKTVYASNFSTTKMSAETFLFKTFNPEIFLEHGYDVPHY